MNVVGTHEELRGHFMSSVSSSPNLPLDIATILKGFTDDQLMKSVIDVLAYPEVHVSVMHRMELGFLNREIARRDALKARRVWRAKKAEDWCGNT